MHPEPTYLVFAIFRIMIAYKGSLISAFWDAFKNQFKEPIDFTTNLLGICENACFGLTIIVFLNDLVKFSKEAGSDIHEKLKSGI